MQLDICRSGAASVHAEHILLIHPRDSGVSPLRRFRSGLRIRFILGFESSVIVDEDFNGYEDSGFCICIAEWAGEFTRLR